MTTVRRIPVAAVPIAVLAGVLGAIQPKINAVLSDRVGYVIVAGFVNFSVAFACAAVVVAFRPRTRALLRDVGSWTAPRWTYTAGLLGASVATAAAFAVETVGVAIFSIAFFAGQIAFGALVDRLGITSGVGAPITARRIQAAVVAIAAVAVSQIGRPVGEFAIGLVVLVVVAGAAGAFQAAFNARIANHVGDSFAATALNVTVGTGGLIAVVAAMAIFGGARVTTWPSEPWLYLGGALGVTIVFAMAASTRELGVLPTTLASLAGQLIMAFVVDLIVGNARPTPGVIAGALLIVVAVAMVAKERGRRTTATLSPSG